MVSSPPRLKPPAAVSARSRLPRAVLSADQEADQNAALLQLRRVRGQAGPPLHLDQRLRRCAPLCTVLPADANGQHHLTGLLSSRCQEPPLLRPLPALAHADGKLDVLLLPHA